jgi:RNA polymerase sigma-70 factor (ECF subfamily)
MEDEADEVLMARIADGHEAAFRVLMRRHLQRSLRIARRMSLDGAEAEDVVQEAWLRVWRSAPRWRPTAAFTTWLYRVLVNLCLDRRRRPVPAPLAAAGDPPDTAPDATATIAEDETARLVAAALAELPERQRAALVLSYYEGLSNAETAEVLGATVGGVEALLVRARRALREKLRPRLAAI